MTSQAEGDEVSETDAITTCQEGTFGPPGMRIETQSPMELAARYEAS